MARHENEVAEILRGIHQRLEIFIDPRHLDYTNPLQAVFSRFQDLGRLIDKRFQQLENMIMTTAAEFKAQQDAMASEISKDSGIISSIATAMTAQTDLIKNLNDQIAALQAAGAGAITQQQLDDLATEGAATLTAAQSNTATLSALAPQNTTAAPAAAAEPQPAAAPPLVDGASPATP